MTHSKPTDLLRDLDSHGIYSASMLDECEFDTSTVPVHTPKQIVSQIEARGLGGELKADADERLISGYMVSKALAEKFLGMYPGGAYHGRGSAFRADFAALKAAGF